MISDGSALDFFYIWIFLDNIRIVRCLGACMNEYVYVCVCVLSFFQLTFICTNSLSLIHTHTHTLIQKKKGILAQGMEFHAV